MADDVAARQPSTLDRGFVGHPRGLLTMFNTEMWERFSYYGMRAILYYYLTDAVINGGLAIPKNTGLAIVSIYGASVYLLSVLGGWVADRIIGGRRAVLLGGVIIMSGHLALAIPGAFMSFLGIVLVALGTGLLKPNVSSIVGELYDADDTRRDSGFSIFYMGINIGAFAAPIVVGILRSTWGYHAGFAAAAVGMGLALIAYVLGRRTLRGAGETPTHPLDAAAKSKLPLMIGALLGGVGLALALAVLWRGWHPTTTPIDTISIIAFAAPILLFSYMYRNDSVSPRERSHLVAYIPMWIAAMLFWMVFEQAATTLSRFADERTEMSVVGVPVTPEIFQSINPISIIVLAPVFAVIWMIRAGKFPTAAQKMSIGLLIAGLSFLMLAWLSATYQAPVLTPGGWFGLVYVVQTMGELCLSPVGLAATTLLAPRAFRSQMMALWFLASASGQAVTAQIVQVTEDMPDTTYFLMLGCITAGAAIVLFLLAPMMHRHMRDVEHVPADEKVH